MHDKNRSQFKVIRRLMKDEFSHGWGNVNKVHMDAQSDELKMVFRPDLELKWF